MSMTVVALSVLQDIGGQSTGVATSGVLSGGESAPLPPAAAVVCPRKPAPVATRAHAFVFDARGVDFRFRDVAVFAALETLLQGEAMRFVADHDPLRLLAELEPRCGARVQVAYIQRAPALIVIDFCVVAERMT